MDHPEAQALNSGHPWPDHPEIPDLLPYDPFDDFDEDDLEDEAAQRAYEAFHYRQTFEPPSDTEIDEENIRMLRGQCLFRWGAQSIAVAVSELPEIEKIAAFGAVAAPLNLEVPRFRQFRRSRIEILHECADLDLAIWTTRLDRLKDLKKAIHRGLRPLQNTPYGGIAHHQLDVHLFDVQLNRYRGSLCSFGECPKQGKLECYVPNCGIQPFLRQFEKYHFRPAQFESAPKVTLFDRAAGFCVRIPIINAQRESGA